jgi:hypothetical protein
MNFYGLEIVISDIVWTYSIKKCSDAFLDALQ